MAAGFVHSPRNQDSEEPAAKRLRFDHIQTHHSTGTRTDDDITSRTSIQNLLNPATSGNLQRPEPIFDYDAGQQDFFENTISLLEDFPHDFDDIVPNPPSIYEEQISSFSSDLRSAEPIPGGVGIACDRLSPPDPYNDGNSISHEVQAISEIYSNGCELCFGMVSDVPITAFQSSLWSFGSSTVSLSFSKPNQLHQTSRNQSFGEVDDRTAKILSSLLQEQRINLQIYCRTINRRAKQGKKGSRKVGSNELQYVMNAIIYGPEDLCDAVGAYLTKCGVFLQDPLDCDRDVQYLNPQELSRARKFIMTSSLINPMEMSEEEEIVHNEDLFSELSSDDHLLMTEAPSAITTPLYAHQKKALTFMVKKECGSQHEGAIDDLWVKELDETGHVTYTNMITELSQKAPPPESKGGLLADQMGLGKSLTMISLIALNPCKSRESIIFTEHGPMRRLKTTLVIVPYSLLEVWNVQLLRHLSPNTLSWMRFHGSNQRKTLVLGNYDIVITTYDIVVRQQKKHEDPERIKDTLFSFYWHRIVLDEAHTIRNRATAIAKSVCTIHATSRWAITGTPIQNRVTDFSSLLEFLQVHPFSNPKVFDTEITRPWLKSGACDITRLKKLVTCISLCRTKATVDLPRRQDLIQNLDFNVEEQEFYNKAKEATSRKFDDALASNPVLTGQYLNALQWLNDLRLLCNHGLLPPKRHDSKVLPKNLQNAQPWTKFTADKAFATIVCAGEAICSVCDNVMSEDAVKGPEAAKLFLSKCLTLTCGSCIKNSPSGQAVPTCAHTPLCKSVEVSWTNEHAIKDSKTKQLPQIDLEQASTKLKTLVRSLQTCPREEKSVVFSYWTYTLDLIESLLKQVSISYTRIDGQHSGEKREIAIQNFQTDESIQVILVSITCGGAGLDLTAASVAYLMEPQWNPMMEEQALSRIHRLGQRKEVRTIRYRMRGSYENQVVKTQELKKQLAADAFATDRRRCPLDSTERLQQLREQLNQ